MRLWVEGLIFPGQRAIRELLMPPWKELHFSPARPPVPSKTSPPLEATPFLVGHVGGGTVGEPVLSPFGKDARCVLVVGLVAVVGAEEDDGFVIQPMGFEFCHDTANRVVEGFDHGGVFFFGEGEVCAVDIVRMDAGDRDRAVRQLGGVVEEEALVFIVADVLEDIFEEDILGVGFASGADGVVACFAHFTAVDPGVTFEGKFFAVAPEVGGEESVGADVVIKSLVVVPAVAGEE